MTVESPYAQAKREVQEEDIRERVEFWKKQIREDRLNKKWYDFIPFTITFNWKKK